MLQNGEYLNSDCWEIMNHHYHDPASSQISASLFQHKNSPLTHIPVQGYSGGILYDGQYIANTTSTVVVTVNYRLGAIGFLVYGTGEGALMGNYGLKVFCCCLHNT